jgi:hypothetical protein
MPKAISPSNANPQTDNASYSIVTAPPADMFGGTWPNLANEP